jgi:DNA polymerase-3 subunit epsilon
MKVLCYDTETQGLPKWHEPSEHPDQPHIVQFCGLIFDGDTGDEIELVDLIVRPDGWTIPDEVAAIHGITTERALAEGVPENDVTARFVAMQAGADIITAYNISFDERIMRIALLRFGIAKLACDALGLAMKAKSRCAMRQATPLCKLPPTDKMMATGRKTFKQPTLAEAVKIILGEDLEDAHDAAVDVLATKRLWMAMNGRAAA